MSIAPSLPKKMESILHLPDAIGLGLFSAVGAEYAVEAGCSIFLATLFGVITGTFGGVIGEVVCNEIPSLFRAAPLYATCSFAGSLTFLALGYVDVADPIPVAAGIVVTVALRLAALRWDIRLPQQQ
ncbi:MAG: putative membrane protein YeiH [Pirellulaceae bacterium]|jgi:uncharacterized membrane protein YeiH